VGTHHYATLREHASGPSRYTLELRRGLVWGFTEVLLVVAVEAPAAGAGAQALVVHAAGERAVAGRSVPEGDLAAFAREALQIVAGRLGVEAGAFEAATHLDLGEAGTLGVEAAVRERSMALLGEAVARRAVREATPAGADPGIGPVAAGRPQAYTVGPSGRGAPATPLGDAEAGVSVTASATSPAPGQAAHAAPRLVPAKAGGPAAPLPASPTAGRTSPDSGEGRTAVPPVSAADGAAEEPVRGLLSRVAGWLRRVARAALGS
jgi:hypothetical protein